MVCLLFIRYIYCISFLITLCISFGDFTFVVRATCKPVFRARVLIWAFNMVSRLFGGSLHLFLFSYPCNKNSLEFWSCSGSWRLFLDPSFLSAFVVLFQSFKAMFHFRCWFLSLGGRVCTIFVHSYFLLWS